MSFTSWFFLCVIILLILKGRIKLIAKSGLKRLPGSDLLLETDLDDPLEYDHKQAIADFEKRLGVSDGEPLPTGDGTLASQKDAFARSIARFALKKTSLGEMDWSESSYPGHVTRSERKELARSFVAQAKLDNDDGLYFVDFDVFKSFGSGFFRIRFLDTESDMSVEGEVSYELGSQLDEAIKEYVNNGVTASSLSKIMSKIEA